SLTATKTAPIPPSPRSRSIRYFPATRSPGASTEQEYASAARCHARAKEARDSSWPPRGGLRRGGETAHLGSLATGDRVRGGELPVGRALSACVAPIHMRDPSAHHAARLRRKASRHVGCALWRRGESKG